MSHHDEYAVQPGKLITPTSIVLFGLVAFAFIIIFVRLFVGLGPVSQLSDGYPWGVWLAYDVATGTAFACGGYALAYSCYFFRSWRHHPMIRSAVLASMFGYALAGFSVIVDIGRYWNAYGFFMPSRWQTNSVMFEVAMCVMGYTCILIIEFLPAVFDRIADLNWWFVSKASKIISNILDKILLFIIPLGMTLPTMHQSSLGSLFIIAGPKLHPLWQTNLLPLFFLINAFMMGFAIVQFETGLATVGFKRKYEYPALSLTKVAAYIGIAWLVLRFGDIIVRGEFLTMFTSGFHTIMFALEIGLMVAGIRKFLRDPGPKQSFYGAMLSCLGGGMYRMNVYLCGYNPGSQYTAYFPSFVEFMMTFGLIALEILAYITLAKLFSVMGKEHDSAH